MTPHRTRPSWLALTLLLGGCDQLTWTAQAQDYDVPPAELDPSMASDIGFAFEAFLSPHQEPGDEQETPNAVPATFESTEPSVDRLDRPSRGHAMVRFTKDLSVAYVDVAIEGIDASKINMFHIHCGRPDQLGPIMVDFAHFLDLSEELADGAMRIALNFTHLEETRTSGHGVADGFLRGCPIVPERAAAGDHRTISGMKYVADEGDLYFNLHTTSQTFFGDIRGRLMPIDVP